MTRRHSLAKDKISVVLLEGVHPRAAETFAADGYTQVRSYAGSPSEDEVRAAVANAHILGIRSRTRVDERVLEAAPKLIAIGCFCIGTDQVDLAAAERRGVVVFNAPFSNTRSVAELVVAEAVLLLRGVGALNAAMHRGEWRKSAAGAHEARGKTLGIVGYGHIGMQVGVLAEALGMRVLFHDIVAKLALGNAHPTRSLDALLEGSDVVTLHVPDTRATRGMIGREQIGRMRPGARLINAARGGVVDLDALADALESGHLGAAAVDVFPQEPHATGEEFDSRLRGLDNVLLTPHIGGSTEEAQESIAAEVAEKLLRYSNNGTTLSSVNFPEVSLPEHPGLHRVLHIHANRPGMLARINEVFSRRSVNVAAQYLQTSPRIGYVVIDIEAGGLETAALRELRAELDGIDGTIRSRVLS